MTVTRRPRRRPQSGVMEMETAENFDEFEKELTPLDDLKPQLVDAAVMPPEFSRDRAAPERTCQAPGDAPDEQIDLRRAGHGIDNTRARW